MKIIHWCHFELEVVMCLLVYLHLIILTWWVENSLIISMASVCCHCNAYEAQVEISGQFSTWMMRFNGALGDWVTSFATVIKSSKGVCGLMITTQLNKDSVDTKNKIICLFTMVDLSSVSGGQFKCSCCQLFFLGIRALSVTQLPAQASFHGPQWGLRLYFLPSAISLMQSIKIISIIYILNFP